MTITSEAPARLDVEHVSTPAPADNGLIGMAEMARRMDISVATARHWRKTHVGPTGFRVGRRVKYRAADIDAFIAAMAQATA